MKDTNKKYLQLGKSKYAFEDRSDKRMKLLNRELKKRIDVSRKKSLSS